MNQEMEGEITLYQSKWLGLYRKGTWDYVRRPHSDHCVGVLAITEKNEILLVEQLRIPVGKKIIEIPAGIVGDEPNFEGESLAGTASRELLEETGYRAGNMEHLMSSPTSAGMSPEITHLFLAKDLQNETEGGGTAGENIILHHVPLRELKTFFQRKLDEGLMIDFKIYAALAAAGISIK